MMVHFFLQYNKFQMFKYAKIRNLFQCNQINSNFVTQFDTKYKFSISMYKLIYGWNIFRDQLKIRRETYLYMTTIFFSK
jgi:hypothetical protein